MLLRAVVQVSFELAPLGVAGGNDARPRLLQLLGCLLQLFEAGLQRRVEMHVVQCQPDLTGELRQHPVVLLGERLPSSAPS